MAAPYFSVNVAGNVLYAKMPGGNIKLPLAAKERDDVVAALHEALSLIQGQFSLPDGAMESD